MTKHTDIDALVQDMTDFQKLEMYQESGIGLELARTYHSLGMTRDANPQVWNAAVNCLRARFRHRAGGTGEPELETRFFGRLRPQIDNPQTFFDRAVCFRPRPPADIRRHSEIAGKRPWRGDSPWT